MRANNGRRFRSPLSTQSVLLLSFLRDCRPSPKQRDLPALKLYKTNRNITSSASSSEMTDNCIAARLWWREWQAATECEDAQV